MAQQPLDATSRRIRIRCVAASKEIYQLRMDQLSTKNLEKIFGIPSTINFFLLDQDNNVELPNNDGSFYANPNTIYNIEFSKQLMIIKAATTELKHDVQVEEQDINWDNCYLLQLGNGTGGTSGQTVYTAPNGTTVTSSAPTYNNSNYYHIGYLFNGQINETAHTSYWLTNSTGNHTLVINFGHWTNLSCINISAITIKNDPDRRSNYSIDVFEKHKSDWVNVCGIVDTRTDVVGHTRSHYVRKSVVKIRINLSREGNYGVCLKEIDCYVV